MSEKNERDWRKNLDVDRDAPAVLNPYSAAGANGQLKPCRIDHGVQVWCKRGQPCEPDRGAELHPLLYTKMPHVPTPRPEPKPISHSRKLQILARWKEGLTPRQIGEELGISRRRAWSVIAEHQTSQEAA